MRRAAASLILVALTLEAFAVEIQYQSIDGQVTFYLDDQVVVLGDAQAKTDNCEDLEIGQCIRFLDTVLHVPLDLGSGNKEPIRYALDHNRHVWSLPIVQKRKILGNTLEGHLIYISDSQDSEVLSTIYFSEDRGILLFTIDGAEFWASSGCGLFAPEGCDVDL